MHRWGRLLRRGIRGERSTSDVPTSVQACVPMCTCGGRDSWWRGARSPGEWSPRALDLKPAYDTKLPSVVLFSVNQKLVEEGRLTEESRPVKGMLRVYTAVFSSAL